MNKRNVAISLIVVVTFLLSYYGNSLISSFIDLTIENIYLRVAYVYSWWFIPVFLATALLFSPSNVLAALGLNRNLGKALVFAAITVSPMLISSALAGKIPSELSAFRLVQASLLAGFMEELLFRGFLFGLLFRFCGWGFIPASLAGAVMFGFGHIYQGSSLPETAGVFLITAMGAVWFAWLFIEWENNLWVPIFLHILMNLSWTLFDMSGNALGGLFANLFRIFTITLTIILTLRAAKQRGLKINRKSLLWNRSGEQMNDVPDNQ